MEWKWHEDTAMSPLWAVRRVTSSKLMVDAPTCVWASNGCPDEPNKPRVNCRFATMTVNNYTVAVVADHKYDKHIRGCNHER